MATCQPAGKVGGETVKGHHTEEIHTITENNCPAAVLELPVYCGPVQYCRLGEMQLPSASRREGDEASKARGKGTTTKHTFKHHCVSEHALMQALIWLGLCYLEGELLG